MLSPYIHKQWQTINLIYQIIFNIKNFIFENFIFLQDFISFYFILFILFSKKNCEQCSWTMSQTVTQKQCTKSKLSWVHQVHTQRTPGCAPTARALRPGLCACSAYYVSAQPAMCLLRLLCACSAFYVPQYS